MTYFPQPNPQRRAPRVQFGGSIAAIVFLSDGRRAKAKLQSVSITGGVLRLNGAFSRGDFVEVAFETQSGQVRGMAEMLGPARKASADTLQPFRFIALADDDHRVLRTMVESVADRSFLGLHSRRAL